MVLKKNNIPTDQWTRFAYSENQPQMYNQLILDKEARNKKWGKENLFNKLCWDNQSITCKTENSDSI